MFFWDRTLTAGQGRCRFYFPEIGRHCFEIPQCEIMEEMGDGYGL